MVRIQDYEGRGNYKRPRMVENPMDKSKVMGDALGAILNIDAYVVDMSIQTGIDPGYQLTVTYRMIPKER